MYQNNYTALPGDLGHSLQRVMAPILENPQHANETVSTELGVMHKTITPNLDYRVEDTCLLIFSNTCFHTIIQVWADDGPFFKGEIWNKEPDFIVAFYDKNYSHFYDDKNIFIHDQFLSRPDQNGLKNLVLYEKLAHTGCEYIDEELPNDLFYAEECIRADYLRRYNNKPGIYPNNTIYYNKWGLHMDFEMDLELIWEPLFI